jgi:hypothetical protein
MWKPSGEHARLVCVVRRLAEPRFSGWASGIARWDACAHQTIASAEKLTRLTVILTDR